MRVHSNLPTILSSQIDDVLLCHPEFSPTPIWTSPREAMKKLSIVFAAVVFLYAVASAQQKNLPADDLDPNFKAPAQQADFEKRVVMVPMRDGVKLYTVIVIPKGAKDAPILLDRTPYNAAKRAERSN